MRIIIDGYNYIGRQGGLRGNIEEKRTRLMADLARYRALKGHTITVIFDGGRSENVFDEQISIHGISVCFSRHGEIADDMIVRRMTTEGPGTVVVTSDRVLQDRVQSGGALVVSSGEFERRMKDALFPTDTTAGSMAHQKQPTSKKGQAYRRPKKERRHTLQLKNL